MYDSWLSFLSHWRRGRWFLRLLILERKVWWPQKDEKEKKIFWKFVGPCRELNLSHLGEIGRSKFLQTVFMGVNSFLKLGGQVVMCRHATTARRCILFCPNLGGGDCSPCPLPPYWHPWYSISIVCRYIMKLQSHQSFTTPDWDDWYWP